MSNCVGSSGLGLPASAVAQHGVERGDHLAHDGDKDDLGRLAGGGEALVECFEGGVVTAGAEGRHVEDVSDRHAAAIDAAMSAELATVEIVGRETDESGDLFAAHATELRQQGGVVKSLTMLLSRHTRRRAVLGIIAGAALAWPGHASAQSPGPRKIGYLHSRTVAPNSSTLTALRAVWERLGYSEPETVVLRSADGDEARLPELAAELVDLAARVLIAVGPAAVKAATAVGKVPVVAIDLETDPIRSGMAASFDRVALLWQPGTPRDQLEAAVAAARERGLSSVVLEVLPQDSASAVLVLTGGPKTGIVRLGSPGFLPMHGTALADAATRIGMPTISFLKQHARAGLLMSYGPNQEAYFGRAAILADRILRGERPGDLPIERPTHFEFALNLGAARALGLTIPASLLARADEVIE